MIKINKKYINLNLSNTFIKGVTYKDCEFVDVCLDRSTHDGSEALIFENCLIEDVNFRNGFVKNVIFRECVLNNLDLTQTKLENVTFPKSALLSCKFDLSILKNVDFSTAYQIDSLTFDGATKSMVKQFKNECKKEARKTSESRSDNFNILDILKTTGSLITFLAKFSKKF